MVTTRSKKKRRCCLFQFLSIGNYEEKEKPLFTSQHDYDSSSLDLYISSDEDSIISEDINIVHNDFYLDMCKIIGNTNYLKNGIVINDTGDDYEKNWYICSTIKFQTELEDKLILWKHIEDNIWDEKTLTVKEILQLNGS
jgi:hypothetical protein